MTTPTEEQLKSRKALDEFVDAMRPLRELASGVRSKLFGRPEAELKEWRRRGAAIDEISGSEGYRLIVGTVDHEIEWARDQLETREGTEVRAYLAALRFVKNFILTTQRDADVSSKVLAGRAGEIPRTTFVASNVPVRN